MSQIPSVIHFRCLDTMGLRDVARAIGNGQAGVRLTRDGVGVYERRSRRGPAPSPSPEVAAPEHDPAPAMPPPAAEAPLLEIGLRRPTLWAVALLTIGITFGTGIARAVGGPARLAMAPPASEAAVAWPRATRLAAGAIATPAPTPIAESTPAVPSVPLTVIVGPPRSAHHHRARAALDGPPAQGETAPLDAPAAAEPETDEATVARAREALTDAL